MQLYNDDFDKIDSFVFSLFRSNVSFVYLFNFISHNTYFDNMLFDDNN